MFEIDEMEVMYGADIDMTTMNAEVKNCSPEDAYVLSMDKFGTTDLHYMCKLSGISYIEMIDALEGILIVRKPGIYGKYDYTGGWISVDEYLSGNLYKKLEVAQKFHEDTGGFEVNIQLLKENLPEKAMGEEVHVALGSPWVPEDIYEQFIQHLFRLRSRPKVERNDFQGRWEITYRMDRPTYLLDHVSYGTPDMGAMHILDNTMNLRPVKVMDKVPKPFGDGEMSVLNKEATVAALEKQAAINAEWVDFYHSNSRIEERIAQGEAEMTGYANRVIRGDFLKLKDLDAKWKPYEHQKNAIAKCIICKNVLLSHDVGSGKTLEYCAAVHELIRMGLCTKALINVPKSTLAAVSKAYAAFYPQDKVLTVYPTKNFTPAKRKETLEKMRGDDYSVVIMSYSSFDMLEMSKQYSVQKKNAELIDCRNQMTKAQTYQAKAHLETAYRRMLKDISKFTSDYKETELTVFDELGFDLLVVDEAHNYKNLSLNFGMDNIPGFKSHGAKKADKLLEKIRYIQERDGHVIFATGTPITNSLADLYVWQTYLTPEELKYAKLDHFNDWINTFCQCENTFEVDVDATNFKFNTRFAKFYNLPELMSMVSSFVDCYQIPQGELGLPKWDGYTDILLERSSCQKEYIESLVDRTEKIRKHRVSRKNDNLLKVTVDGRKCATDARLVDERAFFYDEDNKCEACSREVLRLYEQYPGTCQVIFSDIGVYNPDGRFNLYEELKKLLIKGGILPEEIAFIHEATTESKRTKIEKDFNDGKIRVLIGSTQKLGTGSNIQKKLIGLHHLDIPWRPADVMQRNGRICRQGNTCEKVHIFRYVTKASFDSYSWQLLEQKQKFISQFLSGAMTIMHREEMDCADTVLDYSEIKALAIGNPLIKKRVEVANALEHARIKQRQKRKELIRVNEVLLSLPDRIYQHKRMLAGVVMDKVLAGRNKQSMSQEDRIAFGEALLKKLSANTMAQTETIYCKYRGFDVIFPKHMSAEKLFVILNGRSSNRYSVQMKNGKPLGVSKRLDYALDHLSERQEHHRNKCSELTMEEENARKTLEQGNPFDKEVEELISQLKEIDQKLKEA